MLLCSAVELISIYLALELASFSLFPLVPLRTKSLPGAEAAIKYMFIGGVATTVGLFGFSYILAAQHTTYLNQLVHMSWSWSLNPMAVLGLTLFFQGYCSNWRFSRFISGRPMFMKGPEMKPLPISRQSPRWVPWWCCSALPRF